MVPERFVTEYPSRCMKLLELMEPIAREKELLGSFSLIVATSVFLIPYERMQPRHPFNRDDKRLYRELRRIERRRFLRADFWPEEQAYPWHFSRVMNDVNSTQGWQDEQGLHPMAPDAANTIARRTVNDVLRVVRNALAHGNVVYLDEHGVEKKGTQVQYLGFLSRYEETKDEQENAETYRLVVTTEEGFLSFVGAWAQWLAALPADEDIVEAAK